MNTLRIISDKSRYIVAALLVAFSVFVPMLASAAQITQRSIELSSSTKAATGVSYNVNFTAVADAGAVVVDFCSNSPLLGQACTAPAGLSLTSATVGGGFTKNAASTANKLVVTGTIDVSDDSEISIPVTGVTNPTDAETIYARIITYTDGTGAAAYNSAATGANNPGTHIDDGSVALSITEGIAVSGDVLESLSFCISGLTIGDNCAVSGAAGSEPTMKLGNDAGNGVVALSTSDVSTDDVYTQITTNALGGAVVRLKSDAAGCGGLLRAGTGTAAERCGIKPADSTITPVFDDAAGAGKALFGVKTSTATNGGNGEGAYVPAGSYTNANYFMNFVDGNTGVTSTYGDSFLTTSGAPAINKNMTLTFGASAANNTPAGSYSANLSLIATGTF